MESKQERIKAVNTIIEAIAIRGRHFLSNHSDGHYKEDPLKISYFKLNDKGHLILVDHYHTKDEEFDWTEEPFGNDLCFGGTIFSLLKDFRHFIVTGEYSNHKNGYGGLYCPHWAYPEQDMEEIREIARKVNYLAPSNRKDVESSKSNYSSKQIVRRTLLWLRKMTIFTRLTGLMAQNTCKYGSV